MRPAVLRRVGALIIALGLLGSLAVSNALAASISVTSLADSAADDGVCTLREAITAANTDTASGASAGECADGLGADLISFGVGVAGTITLGSALPAITSDLAIDGDGSIIVNADGTSRVYDITTGTVSLSGLNITGGNATLGGGIRSSGTLTVTDSTISGNTATVGGGIVKPAQSPSPTRRSAETWPASPAVAPVTKEPSPSPTRRSAETPRPTAAA